MTAAPTRRVRLVGPSPALVPLPLAERIVHTRPVITWIALEPSAGDVMRELAAAPGVASLRLVTRSQPGVQALEEGGAGVAASPDQMEGAIAERLAALPRHDVLLLEGLPAPMMVRARLSIVLTGGAPTMGWPAELRAMRSEIDLILPAPRPAALRELLDRLRSATAHPAT